MTIQRLYDLLAEAEWKASDSDLDHCLFLFESLENKGWLRAILIEDCPRISRLLDPQQDSASSVEVVRRCMGYVGKGGYREELAQLILEDRGRCLKSANASHIKRKRPASAEPQPATEPQSIEQRLYELITAGNAVDTDFHVERIAEMLCDIGSAFLDIDTLVQDAPRVAQLVATRTNRTNIPELAAYRASGDFLRNGLRDLDTMIQLYHGITGETAQLLKELFERYGATSSMSYEAARQITATSNFPRNITVERVAAKAYNVLYVWMIEDNSGSGGYGTLELKTPLGESAKVWDKQFVESVVQPLVDLRKGERLLKFVVCVAPNLKEAKRLAEQYANEWQMYTRGHLAQQLDLRDARYVVLLNGNERPRAIFVWGGENHWQVPSSRLGGGLLPDSKLGYRTGF